MCLPRTMDLEKGKGWFHPPGTAGQLGDSGSKPAWAGQTHPSLKGDSLISPIKLENWDFIHPAGGRGNYFNKFFFLTSFLFRFLGDAWGL
jgi:hypothetical protein